MGIAKVLVLVSQFSESPPLSRNALIVPEAVPSLLLRINALPSPLS